jgi:hypothetical protein
MAEFTVPGAKAGAPPAAFARKAPVLETPEFETPEFETPDFETEEIGRAHV